MPPGVSNGVPSQNEDDEVCPVCKSSRYLNPDMRFLINPECYHKMCESCVDRIFSSGPAPCPVAGCHKTLRKHRFRRQTFEDLAVEREVDIRKRVMAILNRREEEFDNKRAYDDFLEQREEMIANLVYNTDVAKTESLLDEYAAANASSIRHNKNLASQESASFLESQSLEQEELRKRREAARLDYDNERKAKLASRENVINRLVSGTAQDAEEIAREAKKASASHQLKKSSARRSEEERIKKKQAALLAAESNNKRSGKDGAEAGAGTTAAPTAGAGLVKGLRKIRTPEPEKPYDPFEGAFPLFQRDYYKLQDRYPSKYLDPMRDDMRTLAGGYELGDYYERALFEAFAGLGCFIDEEVGTREKATGASSALRPSISLSAPSHQTKSPSRPLPPSSLPAKRTAQGVESKPRIDDPFQ